MLRKINLLIALTLLLAGGLKAQNHSDQIIANLQEPAARSVLIGVMPQRTRCKPFRTVLIWE